MVLPESLRDRLAESYGLRARGADPVAGLGDEATVWRVDTEPRLIVRASPCSRDLEQLTEAYELTDALADRVPEVTAPVRTVDGAVVASWEGRPVSVWPYIEGVFLDRHDRNQRMAAAELLARLHRAGLDWLRASGVHPGSGRGLVHGDFYSRNLLWRQDRIAGVIDWDDVRIERLDAELAWVTWELAKAPAGDALIDDRAIEFIGAYVRAEGPARPGPDFIRLITKRLAGELGADDPEYDASLRAALQSVDEAGHQELIRSFT